MILDLVIIMHFFRTQKSMKISAIVKKFFQQRLFILFELCIVILISCVPLFWFSSHQMVVGLDSGYPIDFSGYLHQRLFTWLGSQNFGLDTVSWLGQIPLIALLGILQQVGVALTNVQKITFFFWFFAMGFSMYLFISYLYPDKKYWLSRLTAVFLYTFNFYLLSFWVQGEQTTFSAYTLLPLILLLLLCFVRGKAGIFLTTVLLNIVFFFFNAGGILGIPLLGSTIAAIFSFVFFSVILTQRTKRVILLKRFIFLGVVSLPLLILLNAYYFFPFLTLFSHQFSSTVNNTGGLSSTISWATFISKLSSFANLSRLQGDIYWDNHPNFYGNDYLTNPILISISFLFPILAFASYFFVKDQKEKWIVLFLFSLSVIGFFLAGGVHPPFGFLYVLFMKYIPGFLAFRSPYYKFVPIIYFSFAVLIAVTIQYIINYIKNQKLRVLAAIGILFIIILYHYPYFNKSSLIFEKSFTAMVQVPSYVKEFQREEKQRTENARTLVLPPLNNYPIYAYNWKYWSIQSPFTGLTDKPFVDNGSGLNPDEMGLVNLLYQKLREKKIHEFQQVAALLDIKRVLLMEDLDNHYVKAPTESASDYKELLSDPSFHKIWNEGQWSIYTWENIPENKIDAVSGLITRNGGSYDIFSDGTQSKPFVDATKANKDLLRNLPVISEVTTYSCISCVFTSDPEEIKIPTTKILPSSKLYPIKLWLDSLKEKKSEQDIGQYLGLTLKRVGAIVPLKDMDTWTIQTTNWLETNKLLLHYWKQINILASEKNDYNDYFQTYSYALVEENVLTETYLSLPQSEFKEELGETLLYIKQIRSDLGNRFKQEKDGERLTYAVDNQKVYTLKISSLPKDNDGNPLLPSVYLLNNKATSLSATMDNENIYLQRGFVGNEGDNILTISFNNVPSALGSLVQDTISFPDNQVNCLYAPIINYQWNRTYQVSTNIKTVSGIDNIYIKKFKSTYDENTFLTENSKYFIPDITINANIKNRNSINFTFNGVNDERGAIVFFCSNSFNDPKTFYENPFVHALYRPILMSNLNKGANVPVPDVSYQMINPIQYNVEVRHATGPFVLSFLERFSPQWKIQFANKEEKTPDHFIINGYANAWYFTKTGSYKFTIMFVPQEIFIGGVFISLLSLLGLVIYLIHYLRGKLHKNE